jgi:predicted AlkP superfamily pyrophosphatase or phosphodiesterase
MNRRRAARLIARLLCAAAILASLPAPTADTRSPILILLSFDGWRWDYVDRLRVPNLRALAARGVRVRELVPSFPVLTFPNHFTIVTGRYPEHHGIVANVMNDPQIGERFTMSAATAHDSRWWEAEPIWITLERRGCRTAPLFWPGSEVDFQGTRPSYWKPFDGAMTSGARVAQVLDWLGLPEEQRPCFVTLYQDIVDHAGHDFGPDSPELARAAEQLDHDLGTLTAGIRRLGLEERTTIVVVSDHGMTTLAPNRVIWLDDDIAMDEVDGTEFDGVLGLAPRPGSSASVGALYDRLVQANPHLRVFTHATMPDRLHYSEHRRIPPITGIPELGWVATTHARRANRQNEGLQPQKGTHGFDPRNRDMHAVFIAAGPRVAHGLVAPMMANVDVYDFLCAVLGVPPLPNDGNATATRRFLR